MCECVCFCICVCVYIYVCSMYVVYMYELMYVCIRVPMHIHVYVHKYICTVVYMVELVWFSSIILLANIPSRNIFLLRSRLNLHVTSLPIIAQWRQSSVPYLEKLQHLELLIECCSSPVQPWRISLHTVPQETNKHLWACRKGRQHFICPVISYDIISCHITSYLFTFRRSLQIWNTSHSLHKHASHLS